MKLAERRYCTECGLPLEADGCPKGHSPGPVQAGEASGLHQGSTRWARIVGLTCSLVLLGVIIAGWVALSHQVSTSRHDAVAATTRLAEQARRQQAVVSSLEERVARLEAEVASQPNPSAVAKEVRPSVFTVIAADEQGSAWVVASSGGTSTLVTNFHVVNNLYSNGGRALQLQQGDATFGATVVRVDQADDLALIRVGRSFPSLTVSTEPVRVGEGILVIGTPLGLEGTVASGIVSAHRNGYIQFSAPVSPGDSGGPVIDARGSVVGVTVSKMEGNGAEGLSFAIPVQTVCSDFHVC